MNKPLIKISLLLSALFFGQVAVFYLTNSDVPEIKTLDKYLKSRGEMIYLGDSTMDFSAPADVDKSTIAEMLARKNPGREIVGLSHAAYHLGVYEAYAAYIVRAANRPAALIVPINLRSFSAGFDLEPGYQFAKERFFLSSRIPLAKYFYKPLLVLHATGEPPLGMVRDADAPDLRHQFIAKYLYRLAETDRKVQSLEHLADLAKQNNLQLFFYITPIDYQSGAKAVGPDFKNIVNRNTDLICKILAAKNLKCLNLAMTLGSKYFSYGDYPNEHVIGAGKEFIADSLSRFYLSDGSPVEQKGDQTADES